MKNRNNDLKLSQVDYWKDTFIPVCSILVPILSVALGVIYLEIRNTKHDIYRRLESLEKNLSSDIKDLKEENRRLYYLLIKNKIK